MNLQNSVIRWSASVVLATVLFVIAMGFPTIAAASGEVTPPGPVEGSALDWLGQAPQGLVSTLAQTDPLTSTLPYWTEERMRNAEPFPMESLDVGQGGRPPALAPQALGVPGWRPSRAPDTGVVWPVLTNNPPITVTPPGFIPSGNYTTTYLEEVADAMQFP